MPATILIGFAAGLACAVLYAAVGTDASVTSALLRFLTPLPCMIAGLGWGPRASGLAAVVAAAAIAAIFGPLPAQDILATQTVPGAILAHLAMLGRAAPKESGGAMEWYPVGRVLGAAALMSAGVAGWRLYHLGGTPESVNARLREALGPRLTQFVKDRLGGIDGRTLTSAEVERAIDSIMSISLQVLPWALAVTWLIGTLANLWLAGRITATSGRLARPWPDLTLVTAPTGLGIGLAITVAASFFPGPAGLYGSAAAAAFLSAYTLVGLSVIHWHARKSSWRAAMLAGTYAALVVLSVWAAVAIAILALAEPVAPWSRWRRAGHPP